MGNGRQLCLVEPPGPVRDAWAREAGNRGAQVSVYDDALHALACLPGSAACAVLVGEHPGAPGAASLCRILGRHMSDSTIYRVADPADRHVLQTRALCLSPALSAGEVVARLLPAADGPIEADVCTAETEVPAMQLPQVLLSCADSHVSGRLWVTAEGTEREVVLLSGVPVATRSNVLAERFGPVAQSLGLIDSEQLRRAQSLGRAQGLRIGEALLRSSALDGHSLHRVLSEQRLRQLAAMSRLGPCTVWFAEESGIHTREALLRVHPMTAMARVLLDVPRVLRTTAVESLSRCEIQNGTGSAAVDRYVADLGIANLGGLLQHARTLASFAKLLAAALEGISKLDVDTLLLMLLWSGRLRLAESWEDYGIWPQSAGLPLQALVAPQAFRTDDLWASYARPVDELPEPVADYLFAPATRGRGAFAAEGPVAEILPIHAEFLAHYYRIKGAHSPAQVLDVAPDVAPEEVQRAYLTTLAALDDVPEATDPFAVRAKRAEMRALLDEAYGALGPALNEPAAGRASEPSATQPDIADGSLGSLAQEGGDGPGSLAPRRPSSPQKPPERCSSGPRRKCSVSALITATGLALVAGVALGVWLSRRGGDVPAINRQDGAGGAVGHGQVQERLGHVLHSHLALEEV